MEPIIAAEITLILVLLISIKAYELITKKKASLSLAKGLQLIAAISVIAYFVIALLFLGR